MEKPHPSHEHPQSFWLWVMCLTGVDYFSTLGYQPSIAFESAGVLAPLATVILVLVTLFGALPVYAYVARESAHGHGSIGMLERLMHGWFGKALVLVLLGFAATDFVITKTLSAADAAEHLIGNPFWPYLPNDEPRKHSVESDETSVANAELVERKEHQRLVVTAALLVALGAMFMRGFKEVIGIAVTLVAIYLVLNAIVLGSGINFLIHHPELFDAWHTRVLTGDWHLASTPMGIRSPNWGAIVVVCLFLFPKLALGLSGFETGVAVMTLVRGDPDDDTRKPLGRIRNTRKLLLTAALIMSVALLTSSIVTSTLIDPAELERDGAASNRALAYLAHAEGKHQLNPWFGEAFGTVYDLSTVAILWFAGASAMAGLLNLVPMYLPRYGMAPEWARAVRPLVALFTIINLFVTWVFNADVEAQGGAYATGVLVLMSSACVATVIGKYRERTGHWIKRTPWYFVMICGVFFFTTIANIRVKPDGIKIAGCFIAATVVSSIISRTVRSRELRFGGFQFREEESSFLWESMRYLEFPILVPHRPGRRTLDSKEESIRAEHRLGPGVPIVFLEVQLGDASDFYHQPYLKVTQEGERFVLKITHAASIAHTIAAVGLELSKVGKPPEIHFGWTDESPVAGTIGFLLFGEGNVPWMVHELLSKAEPNEARRPRVVIG